MIAPLSGLHAGECANATSQKAMDDCAGKAFKASDAELNALYKQIEQRLKSDADTTKLLVAAQRAWVAFRDAECVFSSSGSAGGSVNPMIYAMCLDRLTKARTSDLKGYLKCEEGDTSCPVPPAN
ncbi:hypothetical protein GCM10010994_31080 [Chelatococcus reniformis]|uniref:Lysozyme inhibitor LprI-like N-terminal domain-containing protein n=2 Tax=Chelatococcus reniformis TaxID=1494448 RepID=A0A916UFA4_9HYPH|nr:hypothetical protein GCM10010994_31080 [Chelatococcus reniformis]